MKMKRIKIIILYYISSEATMFRTGPAAGAASQYLTPIGICGSETIYIIRDNVFHVK